MTLDLKTTAGLVPFAALVALTAVTGATFMPGPWYESLTKPDWTPPNWVFPIAWTILYVLIAIAGWLAWRREGFGRSVLIWVIGLGFNALWSYLMFGRQDISAALVDIVALWLSIAAFMLSTRRITPTATALFLPYLVWVTYASALNFEIWRLNT